MTKAREIMTTGVMTAPMAASVKDIASTMASSDVGAMPVCNDDGRLQGMITDRDITVKVVAEGRDPSSTKVGDVVDVREVVTIGADDSLEEALATMKKHKVRRLPVIDGQKLVGMISQGDIAVHMPDGKVGDLVEAISAAP